MEEINNRDGAIALWLAARDSAVSHARVMQSMGLHKQVILRLHFLVLVANWQLRR